MKFILSIAAAAMLMISSAQAQHSAHSAIGIKGGLNVFNLETDPDNDFDSKIGFNAGLLGHVHLNKNLALQPEVVYSSQGAKSNGVVDSKLNLGYINVPVLVQYMFDNGFRIEAGPQAGFLVNANQKTDGLADVDLKEYFKTVDFSIVAGISYVHPPTGLGLDARYNLGLSNINDVSSVNEVKNRGFQVGVFYLFKHK